MISVKNTDDIHEKEFVVDRTISVRAKTYQDSTEALQSPVAAKIFGFPWAAQVTVGEQSVKVKKQDWVDWDVLEDPLKGLLEEHFASAGETLEENPENQKAAPSAGLDSDEAKTISELIENQINPALAGHGGYVVLHSVKDKQVFLEMGGGCQGCSMSYMTLKEGIETAIKEAVPSIVEVVDVTQHDQGMNPYYN